ncbi:MAG: phospholipid/cholesterol/gamma-HCH transport system substrate-binding protein [Glaciecola sp.]|jgi:phospholipid/cholesterol/gamma-HCH transport system substrate-binding protein
MRRLLSTRLTAMLAVLTLFATACSSLSSVDGYEVQVQFERTYNLFAGSPVRVLGVDVGKVAEVQTDPSTDFVTVTLVVDKDIQLPFDVSAVIVPAALLGERYVQLDPPFTGGDTLAANAVVPIERTLVPSEFDEVLESLNNFVGEIDDKELGRLVDNLADTLAGNGKALGETIDRARGAINVLQDNDDDLIALVSRLSDLNETLGTRDRALGRLIVDFDLVMTSLADDRIGIDAALSGLVTVSNELAILLEKHRPDLQADIETLTRVGRTAQRNLDQLSLSILSQAELFRAAGRVVNTQKNWLPLVDHAGELSAEISDAIARRLAGVCLRSPLPESQCSGLEAGVLLPTGICLPPIVACPAADSPEAETIITLSETLRRAIEAMPGLEGQLRQEATDRVDGPEGQGGER